MGNQITRRQLLKYTGALGASVLLSACAPASTEPAASTGASAPAVLTDPKRGGTLFYGFQNDWNSMDPLYITVDAPGPDMIYNSWVRWKADPDSGMFQPTPELAEEWDLQDDTITLKLRQGVKFHDGTAWNANVAKWNLDRMAFDPTSQLLGQFGAVDRSLEDEAELEKYLAPEAPVFNYASKAIEVVDEYTVRLHLTKPFVAVLTTLSNWTIPAHPISPEAIMKVGKEEYARNPVGTGPYRLSEWQSGSHVIIERSPDYWQNGEDGDPLPYLDKVHYRLIVEDSVRLLELKSGNIHGTDLIAGKDLAGIKAEPNLVLIESQTRGNNYRSMFDSANPASPFRSKKLRQAWFFALDRQAMVDTLGFGSGAPLKYLIPQGSWAFDDSIPAFEYDKDRATQLLQEALAEDSSLAQANGKVTYTLTVVEREVDMQQAEMIKQMTDSIGFDTTIEVLERAAYVSKLRPGPGGAENYEAGTHRNPVSSVLDPDSEWRSKMHSQGNGNYAHMVDEGWDKLIDDAASTYDNEERKGFYKQLAEKMFDEAWNGYLWVQAYNWAHSTQVKNFKEPSAIVDVSEVWLEE